MPTTPDSWAKWFAGLNRSHGGLTGELLESWGLWAKTWSEGLQGADLDPRVRMVVAQLHRLSSGFTADQTNSTSAAANGEALAAMARRLQDVEDAVARLKEGLGEPSTAATDAMDAMDAPGDRAPKPP